MNVTEHAVHSSRSNFSLQDQLGTTDDHTLPRYASEYLSNGNMMTEIPRLSFGNRVSLMDESPTSYGRHAMLHLEQEPFGDDECSYLKILEAQNGLKPFF